MKAEELDEKFDNNEDVLEFFDLSTLKRPELNTLIVVTDCIQQWELFPQILHIMDASYKCCTDQLTTLVKILFTGLNVRGFV